MKNFFRSLFRTIGSLYVGRNLVWQIAAFALTYVSVATGFDWLYFEVTRGAGIQGFLWPAVTIGFAVPVFAPIILLVAGLVTWSKCTLYTAYALIEAALLGLSISSLYKVFTGRPGPGGLHAAGQPLLDMSHVFRFGIYRGGAFQGWPSSHTMVAFAMSFTLIALFPKNKILKWSALVYAFYIGIGVSVSIHWFSDFVAGAIIGALIGLAVGKSFLNMYNNNMKDGAKNI